MNSFLHFLFLPLRALVEIFRKKDPCYKTIQAFLDTYDRRTRQLHSLWFPEERNLPISYPPPVRHITTNRESQA